MDLDMIEALSAALVDHWSHQDELAAINAELTDALLRVTIQAHSDPKKVRKMPDPFRYPRRGNAAPDERRLDRRKVRRALLGGG